MTTMPTNTISAASDMQTSQLAMDLRGLDGLKREARANTPAANKAVAQQFEALFLQIVLKTMREATPRTGLFDSEQSRMFESLHDQQLAQVLASNGKGLGLAEMVEKQLNQLSAGSLTGHDEETDAALDAATTAAMNPLSAPIAARLLNGNAGANVNAATDFSAQGLPQALLEARLNALAAQARAGSTSSASAATSSGVATDTDNTDIPAAARRFIAQVWPHAQAASRHTGIPAHFMVAQAALETGWGKAEPKLPDGRSSHNLFGIKAGPGWHGPSVEARTTEVINGLAQRETARFRVYASHAEAFQDYARLLSSNPRYAGLLGTNDALSFARGLQQAGYATDPLYASKLTRIIDGPTLRNSLQES